MKTTVGWCAARPLDYPAGTDEYDLALEQAKFYADTSAIREFRTGEPSALWWSTQTLQAMGDWSDLLPQEQKVDVALSWDQVAGKPVKSLLASIPDWVGTVCLLGRHEPEVKISAQQFHDEMAWLRQQIGPRIAGARVLLGPAFILYRARISAPGDMPRFVGPLLDNDLIDFIAWDGYPSDPSEASPTKPVHYESAQSFSTLPRRWAQDTGLPYAWAELHHGRVASDTTGRGSAQWHREVYEQARDDSALFVTQFHYSGGDFLRQRSGATPVAQRLPEADAWAAVIRESAAVRRAYSAGLEDASADEWGAGYDDALSDVQTSVNKLRDAREQ